VATACATFVRSVDLITTELKNGLRVSNSGLCLCLTEPIGVTVTHLFFSLRFENLLVASLGSGWIMFQFLTFNKTLGVDLLSLRCLAVVEYEFVSLRGSPGAC
jgi:hypothetical protein